MHLVYEENGNTFKTLSLFLSALKSKPNLSDNYRSAHSVLLPICSLLTVPSGDLMIFGLALEFWDTETLNNHPSSLSMQSFLIYVIVCYLINILVTAIIFLVNVPVLSEQILSAPPIVSQACKYLTKLFYSLIFPTL